MKTFEAKIVVKLKSSVKDMRGENLKRALDSYIKIPNLSCHIGTSYLIKYDANNEAEALAIANKIAAEVLTNETMEIYEIRALDEVYE